MKKQNTITMLLLIGIIVAIIIFILATGRTSLTPKPNPNGGGSQQESESVLDGDADSTESTERVESTESTESTETTESTENSEEPSEPESPKVTASMDTALFIGDSRTVGIKAYSKILQATDADFFAAVSTTMTGVINYNDRIDVDGVGSVTISELLSQKTYDKIYIMLGINEASDYPSNIARNTQKLIDLIQEKQPGTVIFIMANLHVSQSYQDSRPSFSTANMDAINSAQGALANNKDVFYLDANFMFDDENRTLSSEYSGDGCHLRAKYYDPWVEWIIQQTKSLLGL